MTGESSRSRSGVTANAFRLMGTPPLLGRTLVDRDERPGEPPVVVIGERCGRHDSTATLACWANGEGGRRQRRSLASCPTHSRSQKTTDSGSRCASTARHSSRERVRGSRSSDAWRPVFRSTMRVPSCASLARKCRPAFRELTRISGRSCERPWHIVRRRRGPIFLATALTREQRLFDAARHHVYEHRDARFRSNGDARLGDHRPQRARCEPRTHHGQLFSEALVLTAWDDRRSCCRESRCASRLDNSPRTTCCRSGSMRACRGEQCSTPRLAVFGAALVGILPAIRVTRVNIQDMLRSESAGRAGIKFGGSGPR